MNLDRFVEAQARIYEAALDEVRAGDKRSHWMWFIFPQIAGLGRSPTARHYAIRDRTEAQAYRAHPLLGPRLIACTNALLGWAGRRSAGAILGDIDALKLRSSMTLFENVAGDGCFTACLDAFCAGRRDETTQAILAAGEDAPI